MIDSDRIYPGENAAPSILADSVNDSRSQDYDILRAWLVFYMGFCGGPGGSAYLWSWSIVCEEYAMKTMKTVFLGALLLSACNDILTSLPGDAAIAVYDRSNTDGLGVVHWIDRALSEDRSIEYKDPVDAAAAEFVQLALTVGQIDADYVDAYHGPKAWAEAAEGRKLEPERLLEFSDSLLERLDGLEPEGEIEAIRVSQLKKLTRAMGVRLRVVGGEDISFITEVTEIYDEQIPVYDLSEYDIVLEQIEALVPGEGSLADRVDAFRNSLAIPEDKLQVVFDRAIAECRARTEVHFDLPSEETFRMEFVSDKSWSGYNYYQGGYESLIQINTDFPIIIDRAVDLGCHEGYPGHHVWNLFIERELVGERGWIEYSVNPLFGPFGPIAEGSANYGIELAFPGDEKIAFERDVLFPMAGLDPLKADLLQRLNALTGKLSHATNEISRQYLNGELTREEAVPLIQIYYLASQEKSAQRLRFVDKYRGYVINYNIGRDRAGSWVEAAGEDEDARWEAFAQMLTQPMTPGDIAAATN